MFGRLTAALLLRRLVRELTGLRVATERQNTLIERALLLYAPSVLSPTPHAAPADLGDTGLSFLDVVDASLVEEYALRTIRDSGRPPTEDEVLTYLADEKTQDLQTRLKERAAALELSRLGAHG